jgi:glycosyltransferase involved in cell wall biosynthesis
MIRQILVATCPTGYAGGGLGQHLAQILSDGREADFSTRAICLGGVEAPSVSVGFEWERRLFAFPPFRFRPDLRVWLRHMVFDRIAARHLPPCDCVTAFMGGACSTFSRARALGVPKLVLEMPNSHPANVQTLHAKATALHPFERSWMGGMFRRRAELEIRMADEIRVNSEYTAESIIRNGVDPRKIVRRHLPPDERFSRIRRSLPNDGTRTALVVGSLSVVKGVPFLVDIFRRIQGDDLRLVLFGGWSSRGMRSFLEEARRQDPRISWESGDPAKPLAIADIALHPSWEDGWGYAPAEAMAAGVPVVVSDQTGMKELLRGMEDRVLPAGDAAAWTRKLESWARERKP